MEKQPYYYIPINFALTEKAREWIRGAIQQSRQETREDLVGVIVWLADGTGADGSWHKIDAPGLGFDERTRFDERVIQTLDSLELVFNVPSEKATLFEGQLVDYDDDEGFYFVGKRP